MRWPSRPPRPQWSRHAHDEIQEVAEQVIEDQQREIDELTEIRQELTESATPSA